MASTTSLASRNEMCTFGFSAGGRPSRFFSHAAYCSGKTSLNGRARAKSSSVHSGFSSSGTPYLGALAIAAHLSPVGFAQRDGAQHVATHRENQHIEPPDDQPEGPLTALAITIPFIRHHNRRGEIYLFRFRQRDAVLVPVAAVLVRVELDLHT